MKPTAIQQMVEWLETKNEYRNDSLIMREARRLAALEANENPRHECVQGGIDEMYSGEAKEKPQADAGLVEAVGKLTPMAYYSDDAGYRDGFTTAIAFAKKLIIRYHPAHSTTDIVGDKFEKWLRDGVACGAIDTRVLVAYIDFRKFSNEKGGV